MKNTEQYMDTQLNNLVQDILFFSGTLPDQDLYDLKRKIKTSAKLVTPNIRNLNQKSTRIEKIRGIIKAKAAIEEVQEYLDLSQKLKFGNTSSLTDRLGEILINIDKMEIN